MKKVASLSLGCKVNQYESEALAELFVKEGFEIAQNGEPADIYVINTCSVTNLGEKKSRQLIRKVRRENPEGIVAVIGCYAQTAPEEIKKIEGVDIIVGTKDRAQVVTLVKEWDDKNQQLCQVEPVKNQHQFEPLTVKGLQNRVRAYVKIQDGCSQFCSYCIIPYARGPIRSRKPEEVLCEVKELASNGYQEVVLTGIHVASYGKDLSTTSLLDIIKQTEKIEGIQRIRLSSIEPGAITEEFVSMVAAMPKMCKHFHLSLQSGCDKTLQAMNRKYNTKQYEQSVNRLRQALGTCGITTDMIVGFPGETEEDFEESMQFAKKMQFAKIHVFPFSPKNGTPAASFPNQLTAEVKAERSERLIQVGNELSQAFLHSMQNRSEWVLVERNVGGEYYEGYSSQYCRVRMKSKDRLQNKWVLVTIQEVEKDYLMGKICSQTQ